MQPLVSIIIPAYNHEKYIIKCLDSIKNQTYKNIEIILVDDGSIDHTFDVASAWFSENLLTYKVFRQENRGICETLNFMIQESSGEYVAICASDDYLTTDSIEIRVKELQNNINKDIVFSDAYVIDENNIVVSDSAFLKLFHISSKVFKDHDPNKALIYHWCIPGPVTMIRKSFFSSFSYNNKKIAEDRDCYLYAMIDDRVIYSDKLTAYYRVHSNSITRSDKRTAILIDVAKTNVYYSKEFKLYQRVYLKSFNIDLFLLKRSNKLYFLYLIFKAIRKAITMLSIR
ncbi:glycosyltransferase [Photobacterium damselae subsp. damselae]